MLIMGTLRASIPSIHALISGWFGRRTNQIQAQPRPLVTREEDKWRLYAAETHSRRERHNFMPVLQSSDAPRAPVVSILMPAFNAERYLSLAVESVLLQTFQSYEFIILDDGSTDRTREILKEYARRDSRICLLFREHKGIVTGLNELLAQARGEFVARMDADDIAVPTRLEQQVSFLRTHPKVVCVGGAFDHVDSKGRYLTTLYPPQSNDEVQDLLLRGHCSICHPAAMMRRGPVIEVGGYRSDYEMVEDHDLWLRLGEIGELANLGDVVLRYRLHAKSISGMAARSQRVLAERTCKEAWRRRGISGIYDAPEQWRAGADRKSQHAFTLKYGWWAWRSGERLTALIYGSKAVITKPWSALSWKLLIVPLMKSAEG